MLHPSVYHIQNQTHLAIVDRKWMKNCSLVSKAVRKIMRTKVQYLPIVME